MDSITVRPVRGLKGVISVPGDKSISHRALILGALTEGTCSVYNLSPGEDVSSTRKCLAAMGVKIEDMCDGVLVEGTGGYFPREPADVLDAGNSGTTMRMLAGVLSAQRFFSVLTGDGSLRSRPMSRVVTPLRQMGAHIWGRDNGRFAPLAFQGTKVVPIHYRSPVASAQVKSAVLLAGMFAGGETVVEEAAQSRDHTERLIKYFGGTISWQNAVVRLKAGKPLKAKDVRVPGDPSSAAFFVVAALITRDSELTIKGVGLNPHRVGYIQILKRMGARIEWTNIRHFNEEPVGDLIVRSSTLRGTSIVPEELPSAIDEIPIICIAAACAQGTTGISGAKELRVKESDRIAAMSAALGAMGVKHQEYEDGIEIVGTRKIQAFSGDSWGDHRVAMAMAVGALAAEGESRITHASCMDVSFPGFMQTLTSLFE